MFLIKKKKKKKVSKILQLITWRGRFHLLLIDEEALEVMEQNGRGIRFIRVAVWRRRANSSQSTTVDQLLTVSTRSGLFTSGNKIRSERKKRWTHPRIKAHDSFLNSSRIWVRNTEIQILNFLHVYILALKSPPGLILQYLFFFF